MTNMATLGDLVRALRSGDYTQGSGALRRRVVGEEKFSFCCEGVMCDISGLEISGTTLDDDENTETSAFKDPDGGHDITAFAPPAVWRDTAMGTTSGGTVAVISLPEYWVASHREIDGKSEFRLEGGDWTDVSLAGLNDFRPLFRSNRLTFDHIADLIEWAHAND
jgi:hypothetical protein